MSYQFFLSLITGICISAAAAYLGALMLQKRMSLVAGPLGHLAFPGVALALLYGFDVSLGAFPFIILGILIIWLLEIKTKLPEEALTAIIFASGVGIALLFLPIDKAEAALVGNINTVSSWDTVIVILLSFLIFLAIKKIYSKMILINISEDLAVVEGVNVKKNNLIYLIAIALIVAMGVKLVGVLLTAALVAIPAASARNLSKSFKSYIFLTVSFGVLAALMGFFVYSFTNLPVGILIILSDTLIFIATLFFIKK